MTSREPTLQPPRLAQPQGHRVTGYRCPSCGSSEQIYHRIRPYRGVHMAGAVFLGWLGWLDAESDRRSWLSCDACGCSFRRRTSLIVWWILWCVLLALGAIVAFAFGQAVEVEHRASDAAGFVARTATFIGEQPVAAGIAALWIAAFTGITLVILSWRVRHHRRATASRNRTGGTTTPDCDE